jgi:Flp pilus assembly protein TadD
LPGIAILIGFFIWFLFYLYPVDIASFRADPEEIKLGESSTLYWEVHRANGVEIDQEFGIVPEKGSREISPAETTMYTLSAKNFFGLRQKQIKVTVTPVTPVITYFYADLERLKEGDSSSLHWDVSDAESIYIDHEIGKVDPEGTYDIAPRVTSTYTLTATNKAGSTRAQVKVEVLPQEDADSSTIDWISEANFLSSMEKDEEAIKAYKKAIKQDPTNAKAWAGLSFVLNRQGDSDQAILASENAIKIDPTLENAWMTNGNALANLKRFEEAIQAYDKVIELNSTYFNAWYNKGRILCKQEMYDEAITAYDEAIAINPQFARAWHDKGNALVLLGSTTEADAAFAKAEELGYTG